MSPAFRSCRLTIASERAMEPVPSETLGELTIMPSPADPSRDLLFGMLTLQNGLINQASSFADSTESVNSGNMHIV